MHTNSKLAKSIRLALMFGATATAMTGVANAQDQNEDEEAEEERVERIQVTGSRIQRTDMEGALPVTVIDREAIELSGDISAAELIRNTTFNSTGSFRPQSGSSAQGVSMVDLRGIGSSRSLVLVDGRRLTMSPSTGSSQDLNSIPMAAIERIEILSDGASAVYGSDAIGGVINVITRRDFNGAELTVGEGGVSVPSEGGDRENGSLVFGSSSDTTSVIGGVSWNKREIVFENAYPWNTPGASTYGNNFINWQDGRLTAIPGSCTTENFYIAPNGRCLYNFNATNANEASSSNESLFVKLRHDINDDWTLYSNASVAQTRSFGRYAPVPDINHPVFYDGLLTPEDSYNNPTNPNAWFYDPNNPNAVVYDPNVVGPQAQVAIYHRFAAMGNRDNEVNNENLDFLVGAEGRAFGIDWDFGVRSVRNKTYELGDGYLAARTAWGNVNNFNPGYCADGSFDPDSCRVGYNINRPLDNPDQVLSAGVVTTSRISQFNIDEMYVSGAFDVFEIGGGMVQGFLGFETRDEFFDDQYDSQSEAGLVGGSSGNSAGGGRSVDAAYFEFLVPVTYDLELSIAGRQDDYSDYGSDFSPKVSFRWQPMSNLLLRGSYGEGFRAPTLDILTQKRSFSADSVTDEITCQALSGGTSNNCQINAFIIANPELESESSTQYSFGAAYQATDWLNFAVDYYSIEIENRIRSISSDALINSYRAGDPLPAGTEVNVNARDEVTSVVRGFVNEGTLETSGVDLNARVNFDFGGLGAVSSNFQVSHMLDYSLDGGRDLVLDPGVPEQRVNLQTQWSLNDFTVAWNMNLIGTQYTTVEGRDADGNFDDCNDPGAGVDVARCGNWGTYVTHDLQLSYNTPWNGRITVGAQNLFEKLPKIGTANRAGGEYAFGGRNYNFNLYNANGRFTYVRYTQTF
ncbi:MULTISPECIES: TonB-dependent siderophore receptor [Gammaproteobacteria]|uniref:TonB-dependent receptor plug domain-containing protein n=1 Tax=Gammaproteobacteria TaxID=1236 RepID=UPI000DCFF07A|nr:MULTISPECIES: TonB-dependent receptor [Gammaproteobacteria]RTE86001.1 TonB-dependent receptor [Aliidiomarina sp. B3213]TCZ91355.1 TonB-dependent receptor [Lysobacter sp. N42]